MRPWGLPTRLARALMTARHALAWLHRRSAPAEVVTLELVMGAWVSQAVCVAAKLGVADALAKGPRNATELSASLGCDADALHRLLRALAQHGVFEHRRDGRFAQNALSAQLRSDVSRSVRPFALFLGSEAHRHHWSHLEQSIRQGAPCVPSLRGHDFFAYASLTPAFGALFHEAMSGLSALSENVLLKEYDFARFRTIVDVGGGRGQLLSSILKRAPEARGVLFDLPEVCAHAPALLAHHGVLDRCSVSHGSLLNGVPPGADAYVLKHILHDWSDQEAAVILGHVRDAIAEHGTLLIFDCIVPPGASPHLAKLTDLEMLLCLGGRERTRADFAALLERSGFRLSRVIDTAAPISLIEARPRARAIATRSAQRVAPASYSAEP